VAGFHVIYEADLVVKVIIQSWELERLLSSICNAIEYDAIVVLANISDIWSFR
jgi:hypothetical protein